MHLYALLSCHTASVHVFYKSCFLWQNKWWLLTSCILQVFAFIMATHSNSQAIIFYPCGVHLSSSFFPRLTSAVRDWMSTILSHVMWPQCKFRMHVWNVLHAARWKYRMQRLCKKSPSAHQRTALSGYIFAIKACIDNHTTPQPFYGLFIGTTRVSRCQKTSRLYDAFSARTPSAVIYHDP